MSYELLMKPLCRTFSEQGFFILHDVLEQSCVAAVRHKCQSIVDELATKLYNAGKISERFEAEPLETRLIRLYEHHPSQHPDIFYRELHRPGFFQLLAHPRLLEIAETLLGAEIRLYPGSSVRAKFPGAGSAVPWHQDYGPPHDSSFRLLNIWTPLVPVDKFSGCLQFVPGSHRQGVMPHRRSLAAPAELRPEYIQPVLAQAIPIELAPGDVVVFDNLLFHSAMPNQAQHIRWSVVFRYQDATKPVHNSTHGEGILLHSTKDPARVVKSAEQWANLQWQ